RRPAPLVTCRATGCGLPLAVLLRTQRRRGHGRSARQVEAGDAAELALVLRVVVGEAAVHCRAVVPDNEVADLPGVAVAELGLGGVLYQVAEEEAAVGQGPVNDLRGV